jgi:hypothetical protein
VLGIRGREREQTARLSLFQDGENDVTHDAKVHEYCPAERERERTVSMSGMGVTG